MLGWLGRLLRRDAGPPAGSADESAGQLGQRSEHAARAFLKRAGFSMVAANYRCPMGEVDLIVRGEGCLIFVEVKARRVGPDPAKSARPEAAVTRDKQRRIGRVARHFCRKPKYRDILVRFDVIAIDWPASGEPVIRHHKSAFRPEV